MPTPNQGYWWDQYTQGRNPFGNYGYNVADSYGQQQALMSNSSGGDNGPGNDALNQPYAGGDMWDGQGRRMINGTPHVQLGGFARQGNSINLADLVSDPSLITYDQDGGLVTPQSNFKYRPDDRLDRFMGYAVPALMTGAAMFGGAGPFTAGAAPTAPAATNLSSITAAGSGIADIGVASGVASGANIAGSAASGLGSGAAGAASAAGGLTASQALSYARNGMTLANIANAITGGNTRNNQNRSGNGGLNVPDFLASLFADNRNNRDLQGFRSFLDDSWRRGDPYSEQRQRDLRSLTELRDDPTGYLDRLPGYRSSQDRGVENAMIRNTVSGHNRGGREGAEIAKYLSEGDFKTLSDREKTLVKWGGGENNPMQLASSAMGAAGIYAGLQGARSTGNAATVASALRSAGLGASTIASIMRMFNNDDDTGSGGNDGEPYDPGWNGSDDPYAIDQRGSPDDDDWMAGMDDFFGNGP